MSLLLFAEGTANLSEQNKMSKCKINYFLPKFIRWSHKDFTANPWHGSSDRLFKERGKKTNPHNPKPQMTHHCNEKPNKIIIKKNLICPCLVHLWCILVQECVHPWQTGKTNSPEEIHFSRSTCQFKIFHKVYKITIKLKGKTTVPVLPCVSSGKVTDLNILTWYNLAWISNSSPANSS